MNNRVWFIHSSLFHVVTKTTYKKWMTLPFSCSHKNFYEQIPKWDSELKKGISENSASQLNYGILKWNGFDGYF